MERYINKNEYHQFSKELDQIMNKTIHDHNDLPTLQDLKIMLKKLYNIMTPLLPIWGLYNPCFKVYDDSLLNNTTKYWGIQLTNYKVSEAEFLKYTIKVKHLIQRCIFYQKLLIRNGC